jgi:hypothetical protein
VWVWTRIGHIWHTHSLLLVWRSTNSHIWHHPKHHVCFYSRKWACYMERMVVHLYSRVSLRADLYMTQEDQVFMVNVVVIDSTQRTMALCVISRPIGVVTKLSTIAKFASIKGFMKGTTLFQWPWKCMTHSSMIWIISSRSVFVFSTIDNQ